MSMTYNKIIFFVLSTFCLSLAITSKMLSLGTSVESFYSFSSVLSFLFYCFVCLGLYQLYTSQVLVFSWMLIYLTSAVVASVIIDVRPGFYLFEVAEYTTPSMTTVSLFVMVTVSLFFMMSTYSYLSDISKSKVSNQIHLNFEVLMIATLLATISFVTIVMYIDKPAFAMGMSKVVYSANVLNPVVDKLLRNAMVFVPAVGALACYNNRHISRLCIFILILYGVSLVWIGHKFGLILYLVYFSIFYYATKANLKDVRKTIYRLLVALVLLISLVLVSVIVAFNIDFLGALDYLFNRIAQQSQVWFTMQKLPEFNHWHLKEFVNELYTFGKISLEDELHSKVGIYKVMSLTMSELDYWTRFENNQNIAFGFYPLITYYFDFSGALVLNAFLFCIYGTLVWLLLFFVSNGYYFCSIFCTRIVLMMHAVLIQGDLFRIVSLDNVFIFIIMLCLFVFQYRARNMRHSIENDK